MYSSGIKFLPFCLAETARGLSTQSWRLKDDEDDEDDHHQHHQPPTTPTTNHHQIEKEKKESLQPNKPYIPRFSKTKVSGWIYCHQPLSALRAISGSKPPSWCAWWHRSFHRPPWWIWSSHHLWCLHRWGEGGESSVTFTKKNGENIYPRRKNAWYI